LLTGKLANETDQAFGARAVRVGEGAVVEVRGVLGRDDDAGAEGASWRSLTRNGPSGY
jgi:hypothetical protein